MNFTKWTSVVLLITLFSACATAQKTTTKAPTSPLIAPVQQNMAKLKNLQATGDPDFDYIFRMRVLGQGALEMARVAAAQASDSATRAKAQAFAEEKQKELAEMESMQRQMRPMRPNQAYAQKQNQQVQAILLKMEPDGVPARLTGRIDSDYSTLMSEYNRDVSDFSDVYLTFGNNSSVKAIAQKSTAK